MDSVMLLAPEKETMEKSLVILWTAEPTKVVKQEWKNWDET